MIRITKVALAATIAAGVAMSFGGAAEAKKSCKVLAGSGTGVTEVLAKDQALWQLQDSAAAYGGKAAGKTKTACKYLTVVTECVAKQRYCK